MAWTSGAFWEFSYTGVNKEYNETRLSPLSRNDGALLTITNWHNWKIWENSLHMLKRQETPALR